ncbi:hypothetical protein BPJM79_40477 [Bacillus pumilus]
MQKKRYFFTKVFTKFVVRNYRYEEDIYIMFMNKELNLLFHRLAF